MSKTPIAQLNKPDLLTEALRLESALAAEVAGRAADKAGADAAIADLEQDLAESRAEHDRDLVKWRDEKMALQASLAEAEKGKASSSALAGATPVELWVSGNSWNGDEVRLIRCVPSGGLADQWMVRIGNKLLLNDGRQTIAAKPYHQVTGSQQARVRWPFDKALAAAKSR